MPGPSSSNVHMSPITYWIGERGMTFFSRNRPNNLGAEEEDISAHRSPHKERPFPSFQISPTRILRSSNESEGSPGKRKRAKAQRNFYAMDHLLDRVWFKRHVYDVMDDKSSVSIAVERGRAIGTFVVRYKTL